jgi:hypothetical protein
MVTLGTNQSGWDRGSRRRGYSVQCRAFVRVLVETAQANGTRMAFLVILMGGTIRLGGGSNAHGLW